MKVKLARRIPYAEIDANFQWKLGFLFRSLLEVAVKHSEAVGLGSRLMVDNGFAWVLHRIGLDVIRYPEYRESIDVVTWSRGYKGFKAFREFEIYAGPERILAGTSVWLYLDLQRKRLNRIPPAVHQAYQAIDASALDLDITGWKPSSDCISDFKMEISTRNSDYDPLGHVNSAVYFDYVDTLVARFRGGETRIAGIQLQYSKEIDRSVGAVAAGLSMSQAPDAFNLAIQSSKKTHAVGAVRLR